jgi:hypothetical protein
MHDLIIVLEIHCDIALYLLADDRYHSGTKRTLYKFSENKRKNGQITAASWIGQVLQRPNGLYSCSREKWIIIRSLPYNCLGA